MKCPYEFVLKQELLKLVEEFGFFGNFYSSYLPWDFVNIDGWENEGVK